MSALLPAFRGHAQDTWSSIQIDNATPVLSAPAATNVGKISVSFFEGRGHQLLSADSDFMTGQTLVCDGGGIMH